MKMWIWMRGKCGYGVEGEDMVVNLSAFSRRDIKTGHQAQRGEVLEYGNIPGGAGGRKPGHRCCHVRCLMSVCARE